MSLAESPIKNLTGIGIRICMYGSAAAGADQRASPAVRRPKRPGCAFSSASGHNRARRTRAKRGAAAIG